MPASCLVVRLAYPAERIWAAYSPVTPRARSSVTLRALSEGGWIDAAAHDDLERAYLFLREVEHRLQMVADEQTHTLPSTRIELDRFVQQLRRNLFAIYQKPYAVERRGRVDRDGRDARVKRRVA